MSELKYEKKNVYDSLNDKEKKEMKEYGKNFIEFLNHVKTEYLCVKYAVNLLNQNGFKDINQMDELKPGDKIYFVNRDKAVYAAIIGTEKMVNGLNIIGSHIDSPRLDLKPMPLYEKNKAGLLKTQYYGGLRKYQWLAIPLAMKGVVYDQDGNKTEISLGDDEDELCFTISDLLPHLAKDQLKLTVSDFIDPEKMSILFGSIQDNDAKKDKIKETILKLLNKKYGMKEIDFGRSEISFVPAFRAKYIGIDQSMIGGYGQDDRVCSYANINALVNIANTETNLKKTAVAMLVDKEEIGSFGNTSMQSLSFDMFIKKIRNLSEPEYTDILEIYYNSKMLSADVTACVDPDYDELFDIQNASLLGYGIAIEKYTGSGGKYNGSDANAQYMAEVMNLFDKEKIIYQLGTLGKIGKGGGGTIAYILADKGVNVVDCGTAILSMHSPFEVSSEADDYMTYKAYCTFFKAE